MNFSIINLNMKFNVNSVINKVLVFSLFLGVMTPSLVLAGPIPVSGDTTSVGSSVGKNDPFAIEDSGPFVNSGSDSVGAPLNTPPAPGAPGAVPGAVAPGAAAPPATGLSYTLDNMIGFPTIQDFLVAILNVIIIIATPIIVLFIIYAGFKYVTARGNPAQIQEATQALTYAIIGGILIIGAVAISKIIGNLVTAFAA